MKNTIFLDTGVISLYYSNNKELSQDLDLKKKKNYAFITSEVNYIELYNHICRERGRINAQVIMENIRRGNLIEFIPVKKSLSILAGELKCQYTFLSFVDSIVIAESLSRKIRLYTTETRFKEIEDLKVTKIEF